MDTIFALATAPGKAGVSIVRVSGPEAALVCENLTGVAKLDRTVRHRSIISSETKEIIDRALVLGFQGPNSFTGEDVIEFHVHGSVAVVKAVEREISKFENCRRAKRGEFTKRALVNGRLDLTQVEGLGDLIEAETEYQRRMAQRTSDGELSEFVVELRKNLVRAAALLEASIDFADEEIPDGLEQEVIDLVQSVTTKLRSEIDGFVATERLTGGVRVAIVGPPNVGKSTLLNRLAGRDMAITSDIPGTTRDVIELNMEIGGYPVTFVDTAGLRDTEDPIENIGVDRAKQQIQIADMRIFLGNRIDQIDGFVSDTDICLVSKDDEGVNSSNSISAKTGYGVDRLLEKIEAFCEGMERVSSTASKQRHIECFATAIGDLEKATSVLSGELFVPEVVSEHIRASILSLDGVIGRVNPDDLLEEIFSSFCIGK